VLNCIIIDDEAHNIALLTRHIQKLDYLQLDFATTNPIEGLSYIHQHPPDLVFLDIQMDELSGIEVAAKVKDKKTIVFTTADKDYTLNAFEIGVLDYLLKPISFDRFLNTVLKAVEHQKSKKPIEAPKPLETKSLGSSSGDLFLKGDNKGRTTRLRLEDIYYAEAMGNYVGIHHKNGLLMALMTFRELEECLPHPQFARIHKSFIVAYAHIVALDGTNVVVKTDKKEVEVSIGGNYRESFQRLIHGNDTK